MGKEQWEECGSSPETRERMTALQEYLCVVGGTRVAVSAAEGFGEWSMASCMQPCVKWSEIT